jgi:hypothetical protein
MRGLDPRIEATVSVWMARVKPGRDANRKSEALAFLFVGLISKPSDAQDFEMDGPWDRNMR